MSFMAAIAAAAAAFALAGASPADQTLYGQSDDGYFVYKEEKSCALYADYASGTMMRLSYRTDEGAIYFMVINPAWQQLVAGGSASLHAAFPDLGQGHGFAAALVDLDGRKGFSGVVGPEFLDHYSHSQGLLLSIASPDGTEELESFALDGGSAGVELLLSCSRRHFPAAPQHAARA